MGGNDDIRDAAEDQLTFDPDIDPAESHITVENVNGEATRDGTVPSYPQYLAAAAAAADGVITLTGTVRDGSERTAAELLVAGLTGVRSVKNDIQIRVEADEPTPL